ncbi:MAG: globin [Betaproteobacteria bacterium HGW-Betaproteobacteria-11]|nr:MAG: globin [Betaproteobacteria bacterium HGW-Betaproteobacteria-11]
MNDTAKPDKPGTPYTRLGGEAGVRALVNRFYELMDTLPETHGIRKLHPADLSTSEDKLFMFLSGWLGGPQLFIEKFGHPMLRRRHLPFAIGIEEAAQWMICMRQAMAEQIGDETLRARLDQALTELALHMRNRDGG